MEAQAGPDKQAGRTPAWRDWLNVLLVAALLLLLSEAVWLWQTWPVRDLLGAGAANLL